MGRAGLGRLGRTIGALLVGVQALSGCFRTLHCLSAVTESWTQTSGSLTPSESLSRTQNSYPLRNLKVSKTEHTPANGEGVERQKIIKFFDIKTAKYALFNSIIIFGRTYAKGKRTMPKDSAMSIFVCIMRNLKQHKKPRTGNQLRKLRYIEMIY